MKKLTVTKELSLPSTHNEVDIENPSVVWELGHLTAEQKPLPANSNIFVHRETMKMLTYLT